MLRQCSIQLPHFVCFVMLLHPAKGQDKITGDVSDNTSPFFAIRANFGTSHLRRGHYFAHLSRQPEQLKLLVGDICAGGCNLVKRSWEMGNESFYRRPLSCYRYVHFLMYLSCSSHFSASLTLQTEMYLLALRELISNSAQKQHRISWQTRCCKKNQGSLLKSYSGNSTSSLLCFWPRFTQVGTIVCLD